MTTTIRHHVPADRKHIRPELRAEADRIDAGILVVLRDAERALTIAEVVAALPRARGKPRPDATRARRALRRVGAVEINDGQRSWWVGPEREPSVTP